MYRVSGGMVDAYASVACGCGRAGSNPAFPARVLSSALMTEKLAYEMSTLSRRIPR